MECADDAHVVEMSSTARMDRLPEVETVKADDGSGIRVR